MGTVNSSVIHTDSYVKLGMVKAPFTHNLMVSGFTFDCTHAASRLSLEFVSLTPCLLNVAKGSSGDVLLPDMSFTAHVGTSTAPVNDSSSFPTPYEARLSYDFHEGEARASYHGETLSSIQTDALATGGVACSVAVISTSDVEVNFTEIVYEPQPTDPTTNTNVTQYQDDDLDHDDVEPSMSDAVVFVANGSSVEGSESTSLTSQGLATYIWIPFGLFFAFLVAIVVWSRVRQRSRTSDTSSRQRSSAASYSVSNSSMHDRRASPRASSRPEFGTARTITIEIPSHTRPLHVGHNRPRSTEGRRAHAMNSPRSNTRAGASMGRHNAVYGSGVPPHRSSSVPPARRYNLR